MSWNNPIKTVRPPVGYTRHPASYWRIKAGYYLALARAADGRSRHIQYAMDKRDACLLAVHLLEQGGAA